MNITILKPSVSSTTAAPKLEYVDVLSNYESVVWNVKYQDIGDAQIRSSNIAEVRSKIKCGYILVLENNIVPMVVLSIETSISDKEHITIYCKTLDYILDRRPAYPYFYEHESPDGYPMLFGDKNSDANEVKPVRVIHKLFQMMNDGIEGRLYEAFDKDWDFETDNKFNVYALPENFLVTGSINGRELADDDNLWINYYEVTTSQTMLAAIKDLCKFNGYDYKFVVDDSYEVFFVLYEPVDYGDPIDQYEKLKWYPEFRTSTGPIPVEKILKNLYYHWDRDGITEMTVSESIEYDTLIFGLDENNGTKVTNLVSMAPEGAISPYTVGVRMVDTVIESEMTEVAVSQMYQKELIHKPLNDFADKNSVTISLKGMNRHPDAPVCTTHRTPSIENGCRVGDVLPVYPKYGGMIPMQIVEHVTVYDTSGLQEYPVLKQCVSIGRKLLSVYDGFDKNVTDLTAEGWYAGRTPISDEVLGKTRPTIVRVGSNYYMTYVNSNNKTKAVQVDIHNKQVLNFKNSAGLSSVNSYNVVDGSIDLRSYETNNRETFRVAVYNLALQNNNAIPKEYYDNTVWGDDVLTLDDGTEVVPVIFKNRLQGDNGVLHVGGNLGVYMIDGKMYCRRVPIKNLGGGVWTRAGDESDILTNDIYVKTPSVRGFAFDPTRGDKRSGYAGDWFVYRYAKNDHWDVVSVDLTSPILIDGVSHDKIYFHLNMYGLYIFYMRVFGRPGPTTLYVKEDTKTEFEDFKFKEVGKYGANKSGYNSLMEDYGDKLTENAKLLLFEYFR